VSRKNFIGFIFKKFAVFINHVTKLEYSAQ
jgi:hypothetical protein